MKNVSKSAFIVVLMICVSFFAREAFASQGADVKNLEKARKLSGAAGASRVAAKFMPGSTGDLEQYQNQLWSSVHNFYCEASEQAVNQLCALCDGAGVKYEIMPAFAGSKRAKKIGVVVTIDDPKSKLAFIKQLATGWNAVPFEEIELSISLNPFGDSSCEETLYHEKCYKASDAMKIFNEMMKTPYGESCTVFSAIAKYASEIIRNFDTLKDPIVCVSMKCVDRTNREKHVMFSDSMYYVETEITVSDLFSAK